MKTILGISAFYHDSAAVMLVGGAIAAAAQEERFTRIKHTASFPVNAVQYCLDHTGIHIGELDAVVFYDKPLLKFERLLETYYAFAPKGLRSFLTSIPVWLKEKMFLKKMLRDGLAEISDYNPKKLNILFSEHHLSHAASAFYSSRYSEAAILTIDGVGEWATASISHGKKNNITLLKEMKFPHSLGLLYSAFTYYLGFKVNSGEYKLMGLAPYGNPDAGQTRDFIDLIKKEIVSIKGDGSIWLNQKYFEYATGLKMVKTKKWAKLFGFPAVKHTDQIEQKHCNLAYAIQHITEDVVIKMAKEAKRITNSEYLCMAGGVALNCVANGYLHRSNLFKDIFIQPAAGDAGGALGAAQAVHYMYYKQERDLTRDTDIMQGAYLGPDFSDKEIIMILKKYKAAYKKARTVGELCNEVADLLYRGKVIGWFQGRMEYGPRALGNRSILADARNPEMQKKLNLKIKYREGFRPFAPSVLMEDLQDFFELKVPTPYMLLVANVKKQLRKPLPENYEKLDLLDKLYLARSDIPAVTHLDFSARIQTVHRETNPRYWLLLKTFKEKTGCGVCVNTSFNVRGEPIVCTPEDAYKCFMRTEMDCLVMNDFILNKKQQRNRDDKDRWSIYFNPD